MTPRRPRSGAPRRQAAVAKSAPAPARTRRRRRSRLLPALVALLALVAVVVAVVVVTAPGSAKKEFRKVVSSDVQQLASELRQLVNENTK